VRGEAIRSGAAGTELVAVASVRDVQALERARRAYRRHAWREAYDWFAEAASRATLELVDLECYARAAALAGADDDFLQLLGRASRKWARESNLARATECACHLALQLALRGEWGAATGWQRRAHQWTDRVDGEVPARGLLLGMDAIQLLNTGDFGSAHRLFTEAVAIAERCADADGAALASLGAGQALIAMGEIAEGMRCLDEVMVTVTAGEVDPLITGLVYCAVIAACQDGYDARRASEWTRALTRWCDSQPELVPFRGQCLIHRAQVMQLRGHWSDAMEQLDYASARLSEPPGHPAIGAAHYEQAELCRLRGEFAQAESAYRSASSFGHEVQPGLALLRLAQGNVGQARTGINRALAENTAGPARPRLLAAAVEVSLADGDVDTAWAQAGELSDFAAGRDSLLLTAMSAEASGSVLVARGRATEALPLLRRAWSAWHELDAPYHAARVRALVGRACLEIADIDAARMEFEAARSVFERLGARPDLQQLRNWSHAADATTAPPGGLTRREVEILREIASGKTNRGIAIELFLSEKTVARHVSNIFAKLGVPSRAAATAYAYEHDVL
jgi:DNA-binding CsgD family transcriptional regulator